MKTYLPVFVLLTSACVSPSSSIQKLEKPETAGPFQIAKRDKRSNSSRSARKVSDLDKELWGRSEQVGLDLHQLLQKKGLLKSPFLLRCPEGSLEAALGLIQKKTKIPIVLSQSVQSLLAGKTMPQLDIKGRPLPEVLDRLLKETGLPLAIYVNEDSLVVATHEERDERITVIIHDVSDLKAIIQAKQRQEALFFPSKKSPKDEILNVLKPVYQPLKEGQSVQYSSAFIVARLPSRQQTILARKLAEFRRQLKTRIILEARFLKVPRKILKDIAVGPFIHKHFPHAFSSQHHPQIVGSQVQKRDFVSINRHQLQALLDYVRDHQRIRVLNSPRFQLYHSERSKISDLIQNAVFDLEVSGGTVMKIENPTVKTVSRGTEIELQAWIDPDRKGFTLDWQTAFRDDQKLGEKGPRRSPRQRVRLPGEATLLLTDPSWIEGGRESLKILGSLPIVDSLFKESRASKESLPILHSIPKLQQALHESSLDQSFQRVVILKLILVPMD